MFQQKHVKGVRDMSDRTVESNALDDLKVVVELTSNLKAILLRIFASNCLFYFVLKFLLYFIALKGERESNQSQLLLLIEHNELLEENAQSE